MFNEDMLRESIIHQWGKYGAHAEIFDMMLQEVKELRAIVCTANAQLESSFAPLSAFSSISANSQRLSVLKRALEDSK